MKTQIFKSYSEFLSRKDKTVNGVSEGFAELHPNFEKENLTNVGCWNCSDCDLCTNCCDCFACSACITCLDCTTCFDCTTCITCLDCTTCFDCITCLDCTTCFDCTTCTDCTDEQGGEDVREWYLEQNLLFNCTHVRKVRWYHKLFGLPSPTIATCKAASEDSARKKFKLMGKQVGLGEGLS